MSGLLRREREQQADDALLARLDECPGGVTVRSGTSEREAASRLVRLGLATVHPTADPGRVLVVRKGSERSKAMSNEGRRLSHYYIRDAAWQRIRGEFSEAEKARLRLAVTGQSICPPGVTLDAEGLPAALRDKLLHLMRAPDAHTKSKHEVLR